ncbi:hypothetical protein J3R82DRAFT_8591 [Butyriboletus roseoflavus]|nr:hypothetical protein J3R82DRAFT_8591 [Butyriboletus roseoflavus]
MAAQEGPIPRPIACPHHGSTSSRNLVVCIDGTSNQFGIKNTNIVELYSHITKSDTQLTYYSSGLGAIAKVAGASLGYQLSNKLDMAIGRNLHKVIMASYRWLSDNYQDGDSIFLFGFSRGAYQVRALAGMIARVGLLLPGNNEQIPFAFDLYSKTDDDNPSSERPASIVSHPVKKESKKMAKSAELAKTFQKTFCRSNVHIHFVGVWDTVSSVGLSRSRMLPWTTTSCGHICYFRHALALDERRVNFLPEYVYGGRSSHKDDGRIKEVWFGGSHSDVGGGNRYNERLQSGDIPLLWMRSQAITAGLEMMPADVMWKIDDLNRRITPSLNPVWWPLELLPLKRLLYYNSDRYTFRPHFGGPRRILPGQKVHVSVLFKNNYKPYAQFYNNPEGWPEPMFWNDATSHQRLQNLSDVWEKDIFDERSVQRLLDDLERGQPNLDALDRLAFMASFDIGKDAISNYENATQILDTSFKSKDRLIRLSTAVTYCELKWDWPLETTPGERGEQIKRDVSELLKSDQDRRRACIYMPSLCKRTELRDGLMSEENLKLLVQLCDSTCVVKHEEGTSTVAFHSAQALSMLMKLDDGFAKRLIDIDRVTDITEALRSNCNPVLVSVLSVVDGLAKYDSGREVMKTGPTVATLLKLVKQFDDFVAPAAARVLCSLLPDNDLRKTMLEFGVLSVFLDVLDGCSDETKQATCDALVKFGQYDDVRHVLSQAGYLQKLAKRVQSHVPSTREGATMALVDLGKVQALRTSVMEAIEAAKTTHVLVARLNQRSTALSAASALARFVKIDDVAAVVSDNETGACVDIVGMLRRRWFDGLRGEDGLQVLSELLECERLRSAILKAGAIGVLREMVGSEYYECTYAGLHYLRVIAGFDKEDGSALPSSETRSLVPPVVNALRIPHRRVQRIAMEILRFLSAEEDLRALIVNGLLDLLKDRHADVVFAVSTLLKFLAAHKPVRETVVNEQSFWNLSHEYYDGLKLEYNEKGRGHRMGEVYGTVGQMIKRMQVDERAADTQDQEGEDSEKWWRTHVPYELKKVNRPGVYWMTTLLCCPPLLLFESGQRMYREVWQEG